MKSSGERLTVHIQFIQVFGVVNSCLNVIHSWTKVCRFFFSKLQNLHKVYLGGGGGGGGIN